MPPKNDNWLSLQLAPKCSKCAYATRCPFIRPHVSFSDEPGFCPRQARPLRLGEIHLSDYRWKKLRRVHLN